MLTPVDIQQKKFHMGLGYEKKDVNTFLEEVTADYEQMFRSNAELKEQVATLTDELQHYKTKEASLEKSKLLAEKDSEDKKSKASKAAKNIELEAKNKAKLILADAEKKLTKLENQISVLETQYAAYKSNFALLIKQQFEHLQVNDFDVDAMIDEKSLALLGAGVKAGSGNSSFGTYGGDPQMRDESTLGGMQGGSGGFGSGGDMNSDSSVYTSNLGANDNFVDPFNPDKKENGRYNPYADPNEVKKEKTKSNFKVTSSGSSKASNRKKSVENPSTPS
ncbi:MAG: DivIVA domain-containing protein [Wujia sp.]